jgi:SAM-dependent methyltransferase
MKALRRIWDDCLHTRLLERAMRHPEIVSLRERALRGVGRRVLEIGSGTGLNLPFYKPTVEHLTLLEPDERLMRRCRERAKRVPFPTETCMSDDRGLAGFPRGSFDCIVSTWVLCALPDLDGALAAVNRLLRPGGRFGFVEHGLSPNCALARWQDRLTPVQRRLGRGCHLNRQIARHVQDAGFASCCITQSYLPGVLRLVGYTYQGVAIK